MVFLGETVLQVRGRPVERFPAGLTVALTVRCPSPAQIWQRRDLGPREDAPALGQ